MNAALTKAEWQGLLDTDELARAMRIVPAFRAGKPIGFKLYAIRPDSIWAGIGLENGDTLRRLQGQELATSDQALALYNQLQRRAPSAIYADLIRSGCPATLQVSLLDY